MIQKATDHTIEDIHRTRREISDRFGGDIESIAEDAARRLAASTRPVWRPNTTNKAMHPRGGGQVSGSGESTSAAG